MEANFIAAATKENQYPKDERQWIVFSGRSNVGKSSLINSLLGRKNLARTSSKPGRTQTINFYAVKEQWTFVDLPGYGFARAPRQIRERWGPMIEEFLQQARSVELAFLIVDARHEPTALDQMMRDYLREHQLRFEIVATKIDKVAKSRRTRHLKLIEETLGVSNVIAYSATEGTGKKQLWKIIREVG